MNSNRNDRSNAPRDPGREGRFSYPEENYNGGYGTSKNEPHDYGDESRYTDYEKQSNRGGASNEYGARGGEYSDYGPGYSTANDFSGQDPVRGRLHRSEHREDRGSGQEGYPRDREMHRRSAYPDTYRSAMGGYMSEHVGADGGRRDYNQNPNEGGNLYGDRYGLNRGSRSGNYQPSAGRGYMSEEDYDRGTPLSSENIGYRRSYGGERQEQGLYKGKGPRNYRRTDDRIEEDINERLTDDARVDASEVNIKVQNGEVTLTGTVDDRQAKRRAEDIAESVTGVTHVENRLRVHSPASTNPGFIVTPY